MFTTRTSRTLAIAATAALTLAACGGSSDDTAAPDADSTSDTESDSNDDISDPEIGSNDDTGDDSSDGADRPASGNGLGDGVDAVVDTCAALPAQQLSDITNAMDDFGSERNYTSETNGASCIYTWDTSIVEIVIGSSDQVTSDPSTYSLPLGSVLGDLEAPAWSGNGDVTLFADDWSGFLTYFGGHLESGDYGLAIANSNGTVVDPSLEGDLFGEALVAAAAGAG